MLARSEIGKRFYAEQMNLPPLAPLEGCSFNPLPYFLVGDEIFPLKNWLLRPFPGHQIQEDKSIYTYRHSRARRVIENTFGRLVSRWRLLNTSINASVENIESYVFAIVTLHTYVRQTANDSYCPAGFVDSENATGDIQPGFWREVASYSRNSMLMNLPLLRGSRYKETAMSNERRS